MSPAGARDRLAEYRSRRDFARTAEPEPRTGRRRRRGLVFAVQKHAARRLHFDLRLEWDGVLKSWAVTRGPSLDPADRRLAVRTEDHPMAYADFEGTIAKGEYGAGAVMLWDSGTWEPVGDAGAGLAEGKLHFIAHGERMKGEWILVRMKGKPGEKRENWLLMKADDEEARSNGAALTRQFVRSVKTGRTIGEIAGGRPGKARGSRAKAVASGGRRTAQTSPPRFRPPQLARLALAAPEGDDWVHEAKFDGYRCLVALGGGQARCYTRNGLDWTDRFRPIAEVCAELPCDSALIDGEVIAAGSSGGSQFSALQDVLKRGGGLRYYAFDLLSLDGADLTGLSLIERKETLKELIEGLGGSATVQFSEHVRGSGTKVLRSICGAGLEGIVSKKVDSRYVGRRAGTWIKVKCTRRQEFVIGGYSPSDKRARAFASLLLGTFEDGRLSYRGRVGTGFDEATMSELARRFARLGRRTSPFDDVPRAEARTARWLSPVLVAEVDFTELTAEGRVRHGVFLGLRADKEARDVRLETKTAGIEDREPGAKGAAEVLGVRISNPDRVLYQQQGLTKVELARYYEAVLPRMLPQVAKRLMSLVRCPQGRSRSCFYQRHAGSGFPKSIRRLEVRESSGDTDEYLYITDGRGIVAAVQFGALEFHIWWSRIDDLERPDRLVFDLDPDEGLSFADVKRAAFDMRERLSSLGLQSVALVTGGKGVHVVAPLMRRSEGTQVKDFAKAIASAAAGEEPERFTATMSKARRKGRIFIDWLRNERGATAIAPYSTRARAGAPVATPVGWDELEGLEAANTFRVTDVLRRLDEPDPWEAAQGWRQSITAWAAAAVGL